MHGPYTTEIRTRRGEVLATFADGELDAPGPHRDTTHRFYADASSGLVDGSLRLGVFAAAALLGPGEEVDVVVVGFEGPKSGRKCQASAFDGHRYCSRCNGTGRETERPIECRTARARRDDRGRFFSTLGSRFNERRFVGV